MKRLALVAAVSTAAFFALSTPVLASAFGFHATDGDETKLFFDKATLINGVNTASFNSSDIKNNGTDNVDATTIGTISNLGNGFGTVDGTDTGNDFFTSITFVPHSPTSFDGLFFRGQIGEIDPKAKDPNKGGLQITVVGTDGVITSLSTNNLGINKDIRDLGVEALNDTDLIKSITLTVDQGEFFEEFKQVTLSGVVGVVPVPESPTWLLLLSGFGFAGWMLRRAARNGSATPSLSTS